MNSINSPISIIVPLVQTKPTFDPSLPTIQVQPNNLHIQYEDAQRVLSENDFYSRASSIVKADANGKIKIVKAVSLRVEFLPKLSNWQVTKNGKHGLETEYVKPTKEVCEALVSAAAWELIKPLKAVCDHHILTADNRLIGNGYDLATGILVNCNSVCNLQEAPTYDQVQEAIETLKSILITFDFETEEDRAAALTSILTATSRPILETAPLVCITAPVAGTGKGLLEIGRAHV